MGSLGVHLSLDLAEVEMIAHGSLLERGIESLVCNSLAAFQDGGELSVTLLDNDHQWELEVADTFNPAAPAREPEPAVDTGHAPVILPFPVNDHLKTVLDIAAHHRGQLQSWPCRGGGTAYVLVVPNRSTKNTGLEEI